MKKTFVAILLLSLPGMSWAQEVIETEHPKTIEQTGSEVVLNEDVVVESTAEEVDAEALTVGCPGCKSRVIPERNWRTSPGRTVYYSEDLIYLAGR